VIKYLAPSTFLAMKESIIFISVLSVVTMMLASCESFNPFGPPTTTTSTSDSGVGDRALTNGRISAAGSVVPERELTDGRVAAAGAIAKERSLADGRVCAAGGVVTQSECSTGGVYNAGGVAKEGVYSVGGVLVTRRVAIERVNTNRRIEVCGIDKECPSANGCVEAASSDAPEGKQTNCRIVCAAGETQQCVLSFRGVANGIASVRWRTDRLNFRQNSNTDE